MKFLAEREQNSKFKNKRMQELDRLMHTPHHTRATVRVKFPDGYILQADFGALETVKDVYEYVGSCLFYDNRQFILYTTPPKKVLDEKVMKTSMIKAGMVPSGLIHFGWADLGETKPEDGPFMNMERLKQSITQL
uniref:UBX domain-containing protein n=1 Tax=Strombidium inclinatum TaxID=197538 RepID=A0A7S3IHX8_9SPIT|mmetsp:Transcript_16807/g.25886  ORF Transcript_16807/g.25886 Transcript_16807/m.25886 type:complete len:135 (+) Transcript_16807:1046-1450(+)